jgi:hypothetical protein
MASASAKAMPIIQIRTIWVPRLCLMVQQKSEPILVAAEDTSYASINGVPKSDASALSLGVDYRRHQLVYKFDRKQISARHGPLVLVPLFVDQMLTRQRAGRSPSGSRSQQTLAAGVQYHYPTSKYEISTVRV